MECCPSRSPRKASSWFPGGYARTRNSRHAVAAVCAARPARRPGTAGNAYGERAPRCPSTQSPESHAKHTTYHVACPSLYLPLTCRNPSAIISLVRIYALTAGALSRFFFSEPSSSQGENRPRHHGSGTARTRKSTSLAHELCLLLTPFRINTCKSVSKQSTLTIFRMSTYAKQGGGGAPTPTVLTEGSTGCP